MLEESISCSPGNNKNKSRSRRFHKNVKKKCEQHNVTPTAEIILPKELPSLEVLYEESTDSILIKDAINFEYFNPFENEKLLAAADRAEASTSGSKLQNFTSKGFIRLESLPLNEENKTFYMKPPELPPRCHTAITPRSPQVLGPETQFGITESELVRFCDDVESDALVQSSSDINNQKIVDVIMKDLTGSTVGRDIATKQITKSKSVVEEILIDFCGSPTESDSEEQTIINSLPKNLKKPKSTVDQILEDFCESPNEESSPKVNSDDSTPIFRFKSQPIRTYSKKKLFRRNIATDLNGFTLKDDGDTSDSSSGLSVQEDLSQSIVPQLDTVDLNNSVKLCENLLNLSSYFSQLTSSPPNASNHPANVDKTKDLRLSAIVEEIIKTKSKSLRINWNKIEEQFMGFSDYESDSKESTLQELLEDEDDVLQQINCDSLCYERIEPKASFTHLNIDMENTLKNASAVIEKAKALMLLEPDVNRKVENSKNNDQLNCDKYIDTQNEPLQDFQLKDEQLFDDIDIWNDNECLLNYKTQKPHPKLVEHENNDFFNDNFNENKAIYDEKFSGMKNSTFQKPESETKAEHCNNRESLKSRQRFQSMKDPCSSVSLKLSIASRENEAFKTKEANLNEYIKAEIGRTTVVGTISDTSMKNSIEKDASNKNLQNNKYLNKLSTSNFAGFATVSKKPILISDIARQKANEFLKNFDQEEESTALRKSEFSKEDIKTSVSTIPPTDYQGVTNRSPASSCIKQSQNARTSTFLENKVKKQAQFDVLSGDTMMNNNNYSVGFSTASKKIISISNKAKQKADELLKKFEQEEQEKRMLETTFVTPGKYIDNNKKADNVSEKNVKQNLKACGFVGFSTASEKPIAISLEAKHKADEVLKKFEEAEKIEEDKKDMAMEKLTQRHPDEVSEEVRRKAQELLLDIEFFEEAFEDELKEIEFEQLSQVQDEKRRTETIGISVSTKEFTQSTKEKIVEGFRTASRKSIHVSEEASRRAETFFKGVCDEDLPQEFLKCIETDINDTNVNSKHPVGNLMGIVEQVDGAIKSPKHNLHDVAKTEYEHMHATDGLGMKNKCSLRTSDKRMMDRRSSDPVFEQYREKGEDCLKNEHLHSREYDKIENIRSLKRKHSQGNELEKSSSLVTPRRLSCVERSPLGRIENGLLCKSASLPLKECTPKSTLISRKNLLSLSKRKKIDSPGQIIESKNGPKTPEKEQHSSITHCNVSSTPNLKDFFDSVSTSTPRLIRNDPTNRTNQNPSKDTVDSDFRQIQWEDSNNSLRINRTSCVDDVNVTFSQVSPSPKQRIERIKMYGEPPPISPILMINKCRPSGLRRGRSLMKP